MRLAIYTANAGAYDTLKPAPRITGIDCIAFTDSESEASAQGWQPRELPDPPGSLSDRMRAKRVKILSHEALPDYDRTLWADASHQLTAQVAEALRFAADPPHIAFFRHPWRNCIYTEAEASKSLPKYRSQPIAEQMEHYRTLGHPEDWGLWAGGMIARNNDSRVRVVMRAWWDECQRWTYQDQLSLPVILREQEIAPAEFPHPQYTNPWFTIHGHPRDHE